jgi:NADPH:quinone reductase-like Zn-dependent oxidoreductase
MKAAVYEQYGPPAVVTIQQVPQPVPNANEVLIKVHATTVSAADYRARSLTMPQGFGLMGRLVFGVRRPRYPILGSAYAGTVESTGSAVTKFRKGDRVFGLSGMTFGAHAEFKCARADGPIATLPDAITFNIGAAISFGGSTALTYLRDKAKVKAGERILIVGASGAVGTAAVQLAKYFGAHVTAVCSTANVDMARSIGADAVVDYCKDKVLPAAQPYDLIMDIVGERSYRDYRSSLTETGRLLLVAAGLPDMIAGSCMTMGRKQKVLIGPANERADDLEFLADLVVKNKFKPVIGQVYDLEKIRDAHAWVESGRKVGNAVVTVR